MKYLLVVFLLVVHFSSGQTIPMTLLEKMPLKADKYIGTDDYGHTYFAKNNILYKIGEDKIYDFTDLQLGKLSSVDIINPLKLALFYEDVNTVVFLDRHLIEINRVRFNTLPNLRTLGFANTASNNNLWILNVGTHSLEIYNYLKDEVVASSLPVISEIVERESNFNFCWLLLENKFQRYNSYGTLVAEIPAISFSSFSENNGRLVGEKDNELFFLGKNAEKFIPLNLPKLVLQQFFLNDEKLYLYDGEFLYTYQINQTK